MDVLQGICGATIEIGCDLEVAGFACDVATREPHQGEVAGRAERIEGVLRGVDPFDCERVITLGCE
jgi:hypothetical protein